VHLFVERGVEACGYHGEGMVVIADDEELEWTKRVLATTQSFAATHGYFVSRMQPRMHAYHLDDDALLRSCNLFLEALPGNSPRVKSSPARDPDRLKHFYGKEQDLRVRYVRELKALDHDRARDDEYALEFLEEKK
jgi:N4-bis(aminopropyl)spermidine synthase